MHLLRELFKEMAELASHYSIYLVTLNFLLVFLHL